MAALVSAAKDGSSAFRKPNARAVARLTRAVNAFRQREFALGVVEFAVVRELADAAETILVDMRIPGE